MVLRFADCELDLDRVVLRRGGDEVRIEPQAFDVLAYLITHRGTMVRKEQLLDDVWGDRFVSESALTTRIKAVRRAVGDDGSRQAIIRTVHGKGYEFVATVETDDPGAADDYVFVLVPGGRQIDWPKLRAHLGKSRLSLPDQEEAKAVTGYERGAITPFGSSTAWPVVADATVLGPERVAIGGGARGVNLHLAPEDLVRALEAQVVDVTKPDDR